MPETGGILALDLATVTGWAYADPAAIAAWARTVIEANGTARQPGLISGEESFRSPSRGAMLARHYGWLSDMITVYAPRLIVAEAPLPGGQPSLDNARIAFGLAAQTESVAARHRIGCRDAQISTVRKHFTGKGKYPTTSAAKAATIDACRLRGWAVRGNNEADALAVLDWAIADEFAKRRFGDGVAA